MVSRHAPTGLVPDGGRQKTGQPPQRAWYVRFLLARGSWPAEAATTCLAAGRVVSNGPQVRTCGSLLCRLAMFPLIRGISPAETWDAVFKVTACDVLTGPRAFARGNRPRLPERAGRSGYSHWPAGFRPRKRGDMGAICGWAVQFPLDRGREPAETTPDIASHIGGNMFPLDRGREPAETSDENTLYIRGIRFPLDRGLSPAETPYPALTISVANGSHWTAGFHPRKPNSGSSGSVAMMFPLDRGLSPAETINW